MSHDRCESPLSDESLLAYWADGVDVDVVEQHVLGCEVCARRLESIAAVDIALRRLAASAPPPTIDRRALAAFRARGARVAEATADAPCIDWPVDDSELYVLVVPLPPAVRRVDVEYCRADGEVITVVPDVEVERHAGELLLACDRHVATGHDEIRFRVKSEGDVVADFTVRSVRA